MRRTVTAVLCALLWSTIVASRPATAQTDPSSAEALAERFAPVLMLVEQAHACDPEGEPYEPVSVDVLLGNPEVALRQVGRGDPVVRWGVSAEVLAGYGAGFYLDSPGLALDPGCLFETDGRRFATGMTPTIYARIVPPAAPGDPLALQYWFFWYFNDWNDKHEADWEGIQLLFDAPDPAAALSATPVSVAYAQHEGGERASWSDEKLQRFGDRPVVYSSRGSHASYFTSAVFLGRGATEGFGCDATAGPHRRIDPEVVVVPTDAADATGSLRWLGFTGRWGERWAGPYNGPTGPITKERWHDPVGWQEGLRDGSITIPGGEGTASRVVSAFCAAVGWGATQVIELQLDPLRVIVPAAVLALAAVWVLRRRGGHLRSGLEAVRQRPRDLLPLGLVGLPVSAAVGAAIWMTRHVPVVDDLIDLLDPVRSESPTRLVTSLLTGGAAIAAAFTVVTAAVALVLGSDHRRPPSQILGSVAGSVRPLAGVLVRTAVPIAVASATVFGVPLALWWFARWHLAATIVMREGVSARQAMRRSSHLVRGRTASTLVTALLTQVVVVGSGVAVGLVVLTTMTALPFWTLTMIVTGVGVATMPWAAAVVVRMYDHARA